MCGLCGELRFDGSAPDRERLCAATATMRARGPDDDGVHLDGPLALGHRRLSVIDLSELGAQPMADDDNALVGVFNGCIYNHRELRRELAGQGQRFRSTSDTEVVLKAYAVWGEQFVEHLIGMFALAVWDKRQRRLVLARDRFGIKPLYLAQSSRALRFASTVQALLQYGDIDTSLDPVALHHYLSWHSIVPVPRTVLQGIRKLPPATIRVVDERGRTRDRVYWRPVHTRDAVPGAERWSDDETREVVGAALRTAVQRHTVADVPVGVLLSGGVDSSLIVALLAEHGGAEDLLTFSVGFESSDDEDGDEFRWSDAVAKQYGTRHHRFVVPQVNLTDALAATVEAMSEPMASHDAVAFHLLAEQVSKHVKVVQSGQGADEVFGGYDYHQAVAGVPLPQAPVAFQRRFADGPHDEVCAALQPPFAVATDESTALVERKMAEPGAETAVDAVLRLELTDLMPDDPVKRVDNMTMAYSIEARVPFLDHELVEVVAAARPELKTDQGGKGLLKDIARPLLPEGVVDRPKGYFPVPAVSRMDGDLLAMCVEVLRSPEAKQRALFEPAWVDGLIDGSQGRRQRAHRSDRIWQAAVLEMWLQGNGIG